VQVFAASAHPLGGCWRDPDAAFDPDDPCNRRSAPASAPVVVASRAGVTTTQSGGMVWADGASALSVPPSTPAHDAPSGPSYAISADGCVRDLDAAYDPDHPCNGTAPQAPVMVAAAPSEPAPSRPAWSSSAVPAPQTVRVAAALPPPHHFALISSAQAEPVPVSAVGAGWGVQLGAFASADYARLVAQAAQRVATEYLAPARMVLGRSGPPGGQALFQARLIGVSQPSATKACAKLNAHRWDCLMVPPGG
jgi:hypothetical protein